MDIKLCYKVYPAKMTLAAMKYYDSQTGRDLWGDLIKFIKAWQDLNVEGCKTIDLLDGLHDVMSFSDAACIFHALIRAEDSSRSLSEIEDAMFAVGWMPSTDDNDLAEPWPLILYKVAVDVHSELSDFAKKKKLAALEQ